MTKLKLNIPAAASGAPAVPATDYARKLQGLGDVVRKAICSTIEAPKPFLMLDHEGATVNLLYSGVIATVSGGYGSHKSRFTGILLSALLSEKRSFLDGTLYADFHGKKAIVVYIDTERPITSQYPAAMQGILRRAGYEPTQGQVPENFFTTSLYNTPREDRMKAVAAYLDFVRETHPASEYVLVAVLDVITDCVPDFNSLSDTMALSDKLTIMANDHNCTFLCVIHENPGGDGKARGHVGTEIAGNKSSVLLSIGYEKDEKGKESDLIALRFKKLREGKRPTEPYRMRFCQDKFDLVPVTDYVPTPSAGLDEVADLLADVVPLFPDSIPVPKVIEALKDKMKMGKTAAYERINTIIANSVQIVGKDFTECLLAKMKQGKGEALYLKSKQLSITAEAETP